MLRKIRYKTLKKLSRGIGISYAITVCNEAEELNYLLDVLTSLIDANDEIIILADKDHTTDEVKGVISFYQAKTSILYISHSLNGNFATFKNNLITKASKDYLFQIDADEYPQKTLIENLKPFLFVHFLSDCIYVPRINIVNEIREEHIAKWNWKMDKLNRINYPDYQMRLFRLGKNIKWENKVHERLVNFKHEKWLPHNTEDYCLYHIKSIKKQENQNALYDAMV